MNCRVTVARTKRRATKVEDTFAGALRFLVRNRTAVGGESTFRKRGQCVHIDLKTAVIAKCPRTRACPLTPTASHRHHLDDAALNRALI